MHTTHPFRIVSALVVIIAFFSVLPPFTAHAVTSPVLYSTGVLAHTNLQRYKAGVPLLTVNTELSAVATRKMQDLFARQYFAHEAPTGESVSDLAKDAGYVYLAVGENLALGDFTSNKDVVDAWMKSPGHRVNILASKFSEIGIATGRSMYEGRNAWIVVQAFGLPRTSCPVADAELKKKIDSLTKILQMLETVAEMRKKNIDEYPQVSRTLYKERVDAYNKVVHLYNTRIEENRALVTQYNKSVDRSNACIKEKTS